MSRSAHRPSSLATRFAIERRRHDQNSQIFAQRALRIETQRQTQVGLQAALVKLIEDDQRDAFQCAASRCSQRVRMPSVTTSMRVCALTLVSSRVR